MPHILQALQEVTDSQLAEACGMIVLMCTSFLVSITMA